VPPLILAMSEEKMVEKLHLNRNHSFRGGIGGISSQDEQELLRFLNGKKVTISKMERKYLLKYVIKGLPEGVRGRFWLVCSGALGYRKNYQDDYYRRLCETVTEYPNPNFTQINLDLQRTFPTDLFY